METTTQTPSAIVRPARKSAAKDLYNVYAVVSGAPINRVNKRRMSKDAADKMASKLKAEGAPRAYSIRSKAK